MSANLIIEPGSYLVRDMVDEHDRDLSVWKHVAGSARDWIVIGWAGQLTAARAEETNITRWEGHDSGFSDRYVVRRISIQQRKALEMAAVHGLFYRHARRMWKELSDGPEL